MTFDMLPGSDISHGLSLEISLYEFSNVNVIKDLKEQGLIDSSKITDSVKNLLPKENPLRYLLIVFYFRVDFHTDF